MAVALTSDELESMLHGCHAVVWDKLADPTYVMDWPPVHMNVRKRPLWRGPHPIIFAPQPRHSPDFNRPIEHFHRHFKRRFNEMLQVEQGPRTLGHYWDMLQRAFTSTYKEHSVEKDVLGLPALYNWVFQNGGKWPPKSMR